PLFKGFNDMRAGRFFPRHSENTRRSRRWIKVPVNSWIGRNTSRLQDGSIESGTGRDKSTKTGQQAFAPAYYLIPERDQQGRTSACIRQRGMLITFEQNMMLMAEQAEGVMDTIRIEQPSESQRIADLRAIDRHIHSAQVLCVKRL